VIDRFLSELTPLPELGVGPASYEAELLRSGQAFLYASMLVLLKADSLARLETEAAEEWVEDLLSPEGVVALPTRLERQLRRRAVARPPQQRRVTLQELVQQLESMAIALEREDHNPIPKRRPRPQSRAQATRAIAHLAHHENLTETASQLEAILNQYWASSSCPDAWLHFDHLLEVWQAQSAPKESPTVPTGRDTVGVFWALLLLSAQSKVELAQDEFYHDLRIRQFMPEHGTGAADCLSIA
jgi:segregation and condensation protein A